jgi:hypothetical protein
MIKMSSDSESEQNNYVFVVKEDGYNVAVFFSRDSARSYMSMKVEDFCSEIITSSYRFYKEWSDDFDEVDVMASHRIFGLIPYEQSLKNFSCEKVDLTPLV